MLGQAALALMTVQRNRFTRNLRKRPWQALGMGFLAAVAVLAVELGGHISVGCSANHGTDGDSGPPGGSQGGFPVFRSGRPLVPGGEPQGGKPGVVLMNVMQPSLVGGGIFHDGQGNIRPSAAP